MSNKTRKHIWSGALVLSLAIVGVLAAFVVLGGAPAVTEAHPGGPAGSHCEGESDAFKGFHDAGTPASHPKCADDMEPTQTRPPAIDEDAMDGLASSSTSASANVKLTLDIAELPMDLADGSSIVLYLEDDYDVPDDIDRGDVYFIATGASRGDAALNNGGRVFATYGVEISDDDHFGGDDDWDIQIFIPDFDTRDVNDAAGFQAPAEGDSLQLVITKAAGINNPSEAHDSNNTYTSGYKWSYAVLGPGASVPDAPGDNEDDDLIVRSKISLDDEDNDRGYELTVTGSGFNNGTSAAVSVLHNARYHTAVWWETLDCAGMKAALGTDSDNACFHFNLNHNDMSYTLGSGSDAFNALSDEDKKMYSDMVFNQHLCSTVLREGSREGIATVGSDDKVAVTFEVTVPTFMAGDQNYICMVDGEGRASVSDVEQFTLQDSLRVVPGSAAAGDTVNIFAQDFPNTGASLTSLKIAGQEVHAVPATDRNYVHVSADTIHRDGSATATFDLPGSISGSALEGTVRIDVTWTLGSGDDAVAVSEDGKITITGSALNLSKSEALANETITITGDGFGTGRGNHIAASKITIDGVPLRISEDSLDSDDNVDVSSAGQFVASVTLWPADDDGSNPSLIAGTHTIKVEDNAGFTGSAVIVIPEASISVTPGVAGPRDFITITGENWPIDNIDGAAPDPVEVEISDGNRARRYSAFADSAGRFTVEHRVASDVAIPSTNQVRAKMGADIVKVGSFEVPSAIINIEPAEGQPGDHITLSVGGMPVYHQVDRVEIGGRSVLPVGNFSTDSNGDVTVTDVLIPGLDPGTYSVLLDVEDTIAIGELNVLAESAAIGAAAELPGAVEALGDNLVAIFYFDDVGKVWSFYDPRPEFADLNTLSEMVSGEAYWILVSETVEDVVLNNKSRSLTCRGDDCWNLEVW